MSTEINNKTFKLECPVTKKKIMDGHVKKVLSVLRKLKRHVHKLECPANLTKMIFLKFS